MVALPPPPPCCRKKAGRSVPPPAKEMRTGARAMSMPASRAAHGPDPPHVGARLVGVVAKVGLAAGPGQVLGHVAGHVALRRPAERAQARDIGHNVAGVAQAMLPDDD